MREHQYVKYWKQIDRRGFGWQNFCQAAGRWFIAAGRPISESSDRPQGFFLFAAFTDSEFFHRFGCNQASIRRELKPALEFPERSWQEQEGWSSQYSGGASGQDDANQIWETGVFRIQHGLRVST